MAQLLARNVGQDRVLLVVDQLEELFTTAKGATRRGFEEALRELRKEERVVLVLTLRADFYGVLMESALWEDMGGRPTRLDVAPLRGVRLREAIEAPARSLGVYDFACSRCSLSLRGHQLSASGCLCSAAVRRTVGIMWALQSA